jgi:poly-gamma-glutamate capsule biosynthesis protein CapA/YwtB (metallophosphatase superfamily)
MAHGAARQANAAQKASAARQAIAAQPASAARPASAPRRTNAARRAKLTAFVIGVVATVAGLAACATPQPRFVPGSGSGDGASAIVRPGASSAGKAGATTFTLSAVGDTIMASAPTYLPANGGKDFFAPVEAALKSDLQMANLEEPLTNVPTSSKCGAALGKTCFAFRSPPQYANVLADAGFDLVNIANNHALDFGQAGHAETENALDSAGVKYTGPPGMVTTVTVKGLKIAVIGFAPYSWANDVRDITAAATLVQTAKQSNDLVIVQVHMGGEGPSYQHVKPGTEMFLGENRGNPIAFSHAMIDAGADIIIGHSPHVLRAMEFYKGHLIAYSLGNFAGYHALSTGGVTGVSMILRVTLRADGSFVSARMIPTSMVAPGVPRMDPNQRAIPLVRSLTNADFPNSGAQIAASGAITPPTP